MLVKLGQEYRGVWLMMCRIYNVCFLNKYLGKTMQFCLIVGSAIPGVNQINRNIPPRTFIN